MEPNRLFWGDNLHVMRMLPSNSIDLIYIDPPFFSGANYNVIFGDQNEIRSFTDIWEGGMPSYLIWLNSRLLEMKRLLKSTGTIYVHLDHHASHYVKIEMDKIFGHDNFHNEIIWCYRKWTNTINDFQNNHDVLLRYTKSADYTYNKLFDDEAPQLKKWARGYDVNRVENGIRQLIVYDKEKAKEKINSDKYDRIIYRDTKTEGVNLSDWWIIPILNSQAKERIGYPTQKPEALLERIVKASTNEGDVVADFFVGGGSTPSVAQKLNRRWIACDQSRVAVAITQGRLEALYEKTQSTGIQQSLIPTPNISVEYWGTYEVPTLEDLTNMEFRNFVISAYGGRVTSGDGYISGFKRQTPIFVGNAKQKNRVTKNDVLEFAREIAETKGLYKGIMLAWSFATSARIAVEKLKGENHAEIDLIQITLTELDSSSFRDHIIKLHDDYKSLLTFILPPEIFVNHKRIGSMEYEFDASESIAINTSAKIVNVQWDFDYKGRFTPTQGFSYGREGKGDKIKPLFKVKHKFSHLGKIPIACRVQDDLGGEKIHTEIISVR